MIIALGSSLSQFVMSKSAAVEFPADAVEETIRRGADKWTCGRVLQERGEVKQHDDPHLCLSKKPRSEYLSEVCLLLLEQLRQRGLAGLAVFDSRQESSANARQRWATRKCAGSNQQHLCLLTEY